MSTLSAPASPVIRYSEGPLDEHGATRLRACLWYIGIWLFLARVSSALISYKSLFKFPPWTPPSPYSGQPYPTLHLERWTDAWFWEFQFYTAIPFGLIATLHLFRVRRTSTLLTIFGAAFICVLLAEEIRETCFTVLRVLNPAPTDVFPYGITEYILALPLSALDAIALPTLLLLLHRRKIRGRPQSPDSIPPLFLWVVMLVSLGKAAYALLNPGWPERYNMLPPNLMSIRNIDLAAHLFFDTLKEITAACMFPVACAAFAGPRYRRILRAYLVGLMLLYLLPELKDEILVLANFLGLTNVRFHDATHNLAAAARWSLSSVFAYLREIAFFFAIYIAIAPPRPLESTTS